MTQAGFGILERIDGPLPIPPKYGLLQAGEVPAAGVTLWPPDLDGEGVERWMNGVELYPYPDGLGDVHDPCAGTTAAAHLKGFGNDSPTKPQFGAMTVWFAESCTASHVWNQEEYKARASLVMSVVEGATIAKEFLLGTRLPLNPHLTDGNGTFPNLDVATSVALGIAMMEAEIAKSGRLGLIHVSPQVATIAREHFAVDNKTGVIRTINGNVVIPDFGYVDTGHPATHAAATGTKEWIYATGPIDIRRTEMFMLPEKVSEALDRGTTGTATNSRTNNITYRAERYYLVDWDQVVQSSVLVDKAL